MSLAQVKQEVTINVYQPTSLWVRHLWALYKQIHTSPVTSFGQLKMIKLENRRPLKKKNRAYTNDADISQTFMYYKLWGQINFLLEVLYLYLFIYFLPRSNFTFFRKFSKTMSAFKNWLLHSASDNILSSYHKDFDVQCCLPCPLHDFWNIVKVQ